MRSSHPTNPGSLSEAQLARRKLLRIGVYAAPAVIGKLMLSSAASAQPPVSCNPQSCFPNGGPCGPQMA
ncbi:MAG TPA: hypothetical protein VGG06_03335 [Thermoanaerobaculia bacterium]|jgi:hypothetical protein